MDRPTPRRQRYLQLQPTSANMRRDRPRHTPITEREELMRFHLTRRLFAAGLAGTTALAALPATLTAQEHTLRLSHHLSPGHLVDVASQRFADAVEEGTNGEVVVEVFPAEQIAGLRQGAEAVQLGTVDFAWSDFGTLANFRPEYGFVSLPFIFESDAHFNAVFNGEVGEELREDVKANLGIEPLGYGNAGFRVIVTKDNPVHGPEDLEGVRIRVPEVPIYVNAFRAVGANPTPMAWGEVYTAAQTGVIDAVENPAEGLAVASLEEVMNHLSNTRHIMTDVSLFANSAMLEGLSPEHQEVIRQAAAEAVADFNAQTVERSQDYWDQLAAELETVDSPDRAAFQEAMQPVWSEFVDTAGEAGQMWIDKVLATEPE